jgi:hypothetical protein
MSCHPPQCVASSHLYYSISANVPVIWCVMLLVSFVLSRLGGHSDDTLWYPGSSMMTSTVFSHMKIHWQGKNSPVFILTHVILDLCSVLWIIDSVRLFMHWCTCHSLFAHSEHSEPVHSCHLWYTSGTMHLAINVSSLTSFHSKKLNGHV